MRRHHGSLFLLTVALSALSAGCGGNLGLVGHNPNGEIVYQGISERRYVHKLAEALTHLDDSVPSALAAAERGHSDWVLRTAVVGFAVDAAVGFGPFGAHIRPKLRVAFARGESPPIP